MSNLTILPIRKMVNGHDRHNSCNEHLFHLCQSLWKFFLSQSIANSCMAITLIQCCTMALTVMCKFLYLRRNGKAVHLRNDGTYENWRAEASLPCLLNYSNFRYIYWRAEASLPCLLNYPNFRYVWGEPERASHLPYCFPKSSLYIIIYIYTRAVRPWSNLVPRNAARKRRTSQ